MIDIRQLTIGSHVSVDGKRVRVNEILTVRLEGQPMKLTVSRNKLVDGFVSIESVEPIPLTAELLEELGFEDCSKKRWHTQDWDKRFGDGLYVSFSAVGDGVYWRVQHSNKTMECGNTICRYLHEAEAFLALHGVELIGD